MVELLRDGVRGLLVAALPGQQLVDERVVRLAQDVLLQVLLEALNGVDELERLDLPLQSKWGEVSDRCLGFPAMSLNFGEEEKP